MLYEWLPAYFDFLELRLWLEIDPGRIRALTVHALVYRDSIHPLRLPHHKD